MTTRIEDAVAEIKNESFSRARVEAIAAQHKEALLAEQSKEPVNTITEDYLAQEIEQVVEHFGKGCLYFPSSLIQATLPHRPVTGNEFVRVNGNLSVSLMTPSSLGGLPFGTSPRLLLMFITSEVKRRKSQEIHFGRNMQSVLKTLGVSITSGPRGSVKTYTDQLIRLSGTSFSIVQTFQNEKYKSIEIKSQTLFKETRLWWNESHDKGDARAMLSDEFFEVLTNSGVPLDKQAIHHFGRSPLALDIYCWLTYKLRLLRKPAVVPWDILRQQLGSEYKEMKTFKFNFLKSLQLVKAVYDEANVGEHKNGLLLRPSAPHVLELLP